MARLLWNPEVDADALVTEWMRGVYGAAWKPMRAWFDRLHEQVRAPDRHLTIYDLPKPELFTPELLADGEKYFDEAERAAAADPLARAYVAKARLGLRYVRLVHHPSAGAELDSFLADVRRFGITQIAEGREVASFEADQRRSASSTRKD